MKDAILSSDGVPVVSVTLCESVTVSKMPPLKIEGVSLLNNVKYEDDAIRVWRAYCIGPGKIIPTEKLQCPSLAEMPALTVTSTQPSSFASVKQRRTHVSPNEDQVEQEAENEDDTRGAAEAVFTCPEEGCTQTFLRHSSVQRHLDCGKHKRALARETLLYRAAVTYAEILQGQTAGVPELNTVTRPVSPHCDSTLPVGWALKSGSSRRVRFTPSQKSYLDEKFRLGEQSGQKSDPESVSRAIINKKD